MKKKSKFHLKKHLVMHGASTAHSSPIKAFMQSPHGKLVRKK